MFVVVLILCFENHLIAVLANVFNGFMLTVRPDMHRIWLSLFIFSLYIQNFLYTEIKLKEKLFNSYDNKIM